MKRKKVKPILVRPSEELRKRIEEEARRERRSMGNLCNVVLIRHFFREGLDVEPQEGG